MTANYWIGSTIATDEDHDLCYDRYAIRYPDLACYHYEVADDLGSVRIVSATENPLSENGIWTLAEVYATDGTWHATDAVAALMAEAARQQRASV